MHTLYLYTHIRYIHTIIYTGFFIVAKSYETKWQTSSHFTLNTLISMSSKYIFQHSPNNMTTSEKINNDFLVPISFLHFLIVLRMCHLLLLYALQIRIKLQVTSYIWLFCLSSLFYCRKQSHHFIFHIFGFQKILLLF